MTKKETKTDAQAEYDHFKDFANDMEGYEGINMDTMAIPFIRILQTLSPQLKKTKAEFIPEAEEGMIINSVSGMIYEKPLRIVIGKFDRHYIEWKPKRAGFVAAHAPELIENEARYIRNEKNQLIDPDTNNLLVDTYMYYVLLPDYMDEGVCLISLSSTQLKEAKKLNRMLMTTKLPGTNRKALPYFMEWELDVVEASNDQGDWWAPVFKFARFVGPEVLEHVVEQRAQIPNKTVDYAQIEENAGAQQKTSSKY